MKEKTLSNLFFILMLIGSVAITLSALNIGRTFISEHIYWFVVPLWIGMIGSSVVQRKIKKQNQ